MTTEMEAINALLSYTMKVSQGTADTNTLNTLIAGLRNAFSPGEEDRRKAETTAALCARKSLELRIIESLLFNPDYEYDTGTDADYCTPLTDRVHGFIKAQKQVDTAAPIDCATNEFSSRTCERGTQSCTVEHPTMVIPAFLLRRLNAWERTAEPAPRNELESLQAILATFGKLGPEEALNAIRQRALLLEQATNAAPAAVRPQFRVTVAKMTESHQVTYHVRLNNGLPPSEDSDLECDGAAGSGLTPYHSTSEDNAEHEARAWAEFLGVDVTGQTAAS